MRDPLTATGFIRALRRYGVPENRERYQDMLSAGRDDKFIGVRMGQVFKLAKEFVAMDLAEVEKLLENPFHEARVGAVSIMDFQARDRKTPPERRKALFDLYVRRHDRINSWDLVDRSAIYVVGSYLADKPRAALYRLARSKHMPERRTAIVSTAYFIKQGDLDDTFRIAKLLLRDKEDLVHKAVGWMLRYAGDKQRGKLLRFLDENAVTMPRAMLRYAIEKLPKSKRDHYLGLKKSKQ